MNVAKQINKYQESDKYRELKKEEIEYQDFPVKAVCKTVIGYDSSTDSDCESDTSSSDGSSSSFCFECETVQGIVVVTKRRMFIYNFDSDSTILNMPWEDSSTCALDMKVTDSNLLKISVNSLNPTPDENIEMTISVSSDLAQKIHNFSHKKISA